MANLFNQSMSKNNVLKRVGNISQIMGASKVICNDGLGKGTELIIVKNGKGLNLTLVPDRGLDILYAAYKEIPLAWIARNKVVSNHDYNDKGIGWLRNFGGGLLTTCGLISCGGPSTDQGKEFGLHGRISNISAENVCIKEYWQGDDYYITVSGRLRESNTFFENIVLDREITVSSANNQIKICDKITNEGFKKEPSMIIYHMNYGYPLVSKNSELKIDPDDTVVRGDDQSEKNNWNKFSDPIHGFEEVVYYHDLKPGKNNKCKFELINKDVGISVEATWDKSALDTLIEWKMMGESDYVLGLEPANCTANGRASERQAGRMKFLESFEEKIIELTLDVKEI